MIAHSLPPIGSAIRRGQTKVVKAEFISRKDVI